MPTYRNAPTTPQDISTHQPAGVYSSDGSPISRPTPQVALSASRCVCQTFRAPNQRHSRSSSERQVGLLSNCAPTAADHQHAQPEPQIGPPEPTHVCASPPPSGDPSMLRHRRSSSIASSALTPLGPSSRNWRTTTSSGSSNSRNCRCRRRWTAARAGRCGLTREGPSQARSGRRRHAPARRAAGRPAWPRAARSCGRPRPARCGAERRPDPHTPGRRRSD